VPKRLKSAKEWGIRPHVFHMWADEVIVAIEMQHERLLAHRVPANYRELSETEQVEVTEGSFRCRGNLVPRLRKLSQPARDHTP
jgi:hypothetical protein